MIVCHVNKCNEEALVNIDLPVPNTNLVLKHIWVCDKHYEEILNSKSKVVVI